MTETSHRPLRVLFVIPGLSIGWRMIFTKNDIAAIEKWGVQGCSFHLLSRTSPRMLMKEAVRFRKVVRAFRPDLIHVHYGTVTAGFCAALTELPLVVTYQGSDLNPCSSMNPMRSAAGRLLSQVAALRADRIICVSRELRDRLWWCRGKAVVLPSGVDTAVFYPVPREEARARLGWALHEKIVLSSAGTDPIRKRLDLARAAVQAAEARCGFIRLVVLDGNTAHQDMPMLYNAADCLLMTSDWEGSPNVVKEAIACDLPVVSVPVGDVAERLRAVRPSSIIARDPRELGAALADLLERPRRSNGHEVIQTIAADRFARQMVSIYAQVVRDAKMVPMRDSLEALCTSGSPSSFSACAGQAAPTPVRSETQPLAEREFPPLRVLYVLPGPAVGSSMIFARKQVEVMADYNVVSEVFSLESRTSPGRLMREARRFRERIAAFQPDLIHAQYGTMTAFFASLTAAVPLVITFRGSDLNPRPHEWWLRGLVARWLSWAAAARAAGTICVSEELKRRLKTGRAPTVVLPSGVDTRTFAPCPRDEARRALGWNTADRIVVFNAGAWPAVKRLDLAQAGVRKAEALCGPIRFVTLDGSVDAPVVATMLNAADALLMTSDWEGSPTIVQEALACALPVVSVDVGDVRERLAGVSPSYVVGRNVDEIGTALAELLRAPVRSNGRRGIHQVSQWTIARHTVGFYHQILGRGVSSQFAPSGKSTAMGAGSC